MDKKIYTKKNPSIFNESAEIHRLPPNGMRKVHQDYGLCIFRWNRGCHAPSGSYYALKRPRYFEYYSISHFYGGRAMLCFPPQKEQELCIGDYIIVPPGIDNRYASPWDGEFSEDAISFYGPVADALYKNGIISTGVIHIGQARRLLPIINLASDPSAASQIKANIALQNLLVEISSFRNCTNQNEQVIELLVKKLKTQLTHNWTVEEMAEFCNLNIINFRRAFYKNVGMLPKVYFDQLRITKAAEFLAGSNLEISVIAERMGYDDPFHFSRRFKKLIGCSPSKYRK